MSLPTGVRAQIIVTIMEDPIQPLTAEIIGDVTHKHILSVQRPITHAFREYMRQLRTKLIPKGE
jgi:hypothetical protein